MNPFLVVTFLTILCTYLSSCDINQYTETYLNERSYSSGSDAVLVFLCQLHMHMEMHGNDMTDATV